MTHIRGAINSPSKKAGVAAVLVALVVAAVVLSISLSGRHSGQSEASRARDTLAAVPAACQTYADDQPIAIPGMAAALVRGTGEKSSLSEAIALSDRCSDLKRGGELAKLDKTAFTWNAQCVTDLGGKLRANRNPTAGDDTDVLPEANGNITPAKYASCVTFTAAAQDCEDYRASFDAIGPDVRQTAILEKLGCHNTEVRIPAGS